MASQQLLFSRELPKLEHEPEIEVSSYIRSAHSGRKPLPKDLPRERVEYEPEEQNCSCCGAELQKVGEDISEELEYIPARFFIREHARIKSILNAAAIFADETHLKVQDGEKKGLHTGYLWGALGPPGVYFYYSKSRAGVVAKELLGNYAVLSGFTRVQTVFAHFYRPDERMGSARKNASRRACR